MTIGHHLIWSVYGTWLPNDPRGSTSNIIKSKWLTDCGDLHFGRKKIQPRRAEVREFYNAAAPRLKHDVILLSETQRNIVAAGFAEVIQRTPYTCYACAIMPDHVHILLRQHRHRVDEMIANLQSASRLRLSAHLPENHPVWTTGGYNRFILTPQQMRNTIEYIASNPSKEGLPAELWDFIQPYNGWLPGKIPSHPTPRLRLQRPLPTNSPPAPTTPLNSPIFNGSH